MRHSKTRALRLFTALATMGMLALAALAALSGCGGGAGVTEEQPTGLVIRGTIRDEAGRAVSGIRITILPNNVSAFSGADGSFSINLGAVSIPPATFTVDVGSRANEYYAIFGYGGRNFQGCAVNLPAPVGNVIALGNITVYSQDSPPPPPNEICQ